MFDWEIHADLQQRNYYFENYDTFHQIVQTSPQIRYIKLEKVCLDKTRYYIELDSQENYYIWIKNQGSAN